MVSSILRSSQIGLKLAFNLILPERCALCFIPDQGGYCVACQELLPWIETACQRCGCYLPLPGICGRCLQRHNGQKKPVLPSETIVPFRYENPISAHIQQLKYRDSLSRVPALARMLAQHVLNQSATLPDVLVPIPLHACRVRLRGFNQATLIADAVGKLLNIPVDHRLLFRIVDTPSQTSLDEKERENNVRHVFSMRRPCMYHSIALIDDVITSGATIRSACATIVKHSHARVSAWAIAKT